MPSPTTVPKPIEEALRELDREGKAFYRGLMDGGLGELLPAIRHQRDEELRERLDNLEAAGEKLAVEARHRLSTMAGDDPNHAAWNSDQAEALAAWNEARNALHADTDGKQEDHDEMP